MDIENKSFADIIKDSIIRIPKIQRDYAQGRKQKEIEEIRNQFVRSLLLVITGKRTSAQLDFVYGSDRRQAFEPLDGQQRLTTLFILHWMLGYNLQTEDGESVLTYETRNTSAAFCKELVKHQAQDFVNEAIRKTDEEKHKAAEEKKKPITLQMKENLNTNIYTPSQIIQNRDWFQWGWNYDPTINSMLVMIDTINSYMDWSLDIDKCKSRLNLITFNHLDLGELGMSDELFIKMNARGKLLSDFDKLKSTLEEEIQIQQQEHDAKGNILADQNVEKGWRSLMDGIWIDLFWQHIASEVMSESISDDSQKKQLMAAKQTEKKMKIFLLRMIALQIFAKMPTINNACSLLEMNDGDELAQMQYAHLRQMVETLYEATYQIKASNLDNLLLAYQNQLVDWRSNEAMPLPDYCITINFKELISDINLWIVDKGDGNYSNVTSLLTRDSYFEKNDVSYFDRLSADEIGNDVVAILCAMLNYLRVFPYQNNSDAWLSNFDEWTRLARNVFNNDNNNRRIDKRLIEEQAFSGITNIIKDLVDYSNANSINPYSNPNFVLQFIKNIKVSYVGIDNQSLDEEISKAQLRLADNTNKLDTDWTEAFRNAEDNPYLWGQIRCLVHWSDGNLTKFKNYSKCLTSWINLDGQWALQELYYNAMLCMQPECWKETDNRLYEFNRDRDNSIKRYLRDVPYGLCIKHFVDKWIEWNINATLADFCKYVIENTVNTGWIAYFKKRPEMIWQSWRKKIFTDKGHVIFAQQKTTDSHCFDPLFLYINEIIKDKFYNTISKEWTHGIVCNLYDSKSLGSHAVELEYENHFCTVKWGEIDSEYIISNDGHIESTTNIDYFISKMESIISYYAEISDKKD